ncbi:MAG: hypothetical protein IJR09_05790 [Paludibacteraceae bacterium]|nr:hypothetical protein [Paludibacteraceae bacterium]
MSFKHLYACFALAAGLVLAGCHSDVDLDHVDTKSNIQLGLAAPVGTISATIGDFLGSGQVSQIHVDGDGVFHYIDTFQIPTKPYHKIDVRDYILRNDAELTFRIKDQVSVPVIPISPVAVPLKFDMELGLEGINNKTKDERIDSIRVTNASFMSHINVTAFDLKWEEIESVKLVLGDKFRPWDGNKTIDIPVAGKGFKEGIEIPVRNFTLSLLKDDSDPSQGTVDKISFSIIFNVKPNHAIPVNDNSRIDYSLRVQMIDYEAIWGFFEASNDMQDENTVVLQEQWEGWKDFKELELRIADPKITVHVTHKVAAPLRMRIDYLRVKNNDGATAKAEWTTDGVTTEYDDFLIKNVLSPILAKDPQHPQMGESLLTDSIDVQRTFSSDPREGHIDQLFDIKPDIFSYSFRLSVDRNNTYFINPATGKPYTQHRIAKDALNIHGYAALDVPFKFKENSALTYSTTLDTLTFIDKLDSIQTSAKILDTINAGNVKLILAVENTIPFDIDAELLFIDSVGKPLHMQLVENAEQSNDTTHLHFKAPHIDKFGDAIQPVETQKIVLIVNDADLIELKKAKKMWFKASISGNEEACRLSKDAGLRVRVGVSANADVTFKFDDKK